MAGSGGRGDLRWDLRGKLWARAERLAGRSVRLPDRILSDVHQGHSGGQTPQAAILRRFVGVVFDSEL